MPHAELSAYAAFQPIVHWAHAETEQPEASKARKPPKRAAFRMHLMQNQLLQQMTTSS